MTSVVSLERVRGRSLVSSMWSKGLLAFGMIYLANITTTAVAEHSASICSKTLVQFVAELDEVFTANPDDLRLVRAVVQRHLPVKRCNVEDVISIAKTSRFFSEAFDQYASYTISFRSSEFIVSFGLRKGTGDIEFPSARRKLPPANERRTNLYRSS